MSCIPQGVKLFIGQIPKDYGEVELRSLFEPYGEIYSLDMLVHGAEGQHRGCAFLTYYSNESAKKAQEELHGKLTLPGARNRMQVKPAFSEVTPENRKLFCGMLAKSLNEKDIRDMFSQFGTIENVSVVRANGESKGCAFVLFETRQQAMKAINAMHHSQTMEGCTSPMVVKLADTEKDKIAKNMMKHGSSVSSNAGVVAGVQSATAAGPIAQLQQQAIYYQQLFNQLVIPQIMAGNLPAPGAPGAVTALVNAMAVQAKTLEPHTAGGGGVVAGGTAPSSLSQNFPTPYSNPLPSVQYGIQQSSGAAIDSKQEEGPDGANLFIYQIPPEYADSDLMQLFAPFGSVLSAKVFFDKATQLSKGFGFVSFEEPSSAANAITSMNNFVLGNKRLRVSLKKKKGSKPY